MLTSQLIFLLCPQQTLIDWRIRKHIFPFAYPVSSIHTHTHTIPLFGNTKISDSIDFFLPIHCIFLSKIHWILVKLPKYLSWKGIHKSFNFNCLSDFYGLLCNRSLLGKNLTRKVWLSQSIDFLKNRNMSVITQLLNVHKIPSQW